MPKQPAASPAIEPDRYRADRACRREAGANSDIRLTELADRLAERGLRLAYHHHMGTVVETPAEIDRLMAATRGSVGLLLDTGHLAFAGADPADWTAHQPCPLQGRPAGCAGTRSLRR